MIHLTPIDGLRAYLALWVVIAHVLVLAGYDFELRQGLPRLLREGALAVDVFVIISGFVIFHMLDHKRERYIPFVIRRFFRLYPLFIILFLIGIPAALIVSRNALLAGHLGYLNPHWVKFFNEISTSGWSHLGKHILLHATMLHGVIPQVVLPLSPIVFLPPAWSISLEWQFYLLAPLVFSLAISSSLAARGLLCAGCVLLFFFAVEGFYPYVECGAALPFHAEFFFFGCVSFFLYKRFVQGARKEGILLVGACLAIFLFHLGGKSHTLIPICLWIAFFSLLLEPADSMFGRWISPLFTHSAIQYLGKISYSIYLSHMLVIFAAQYVILHFMPELSQKQHFTVLLVATLAITIPLSALLYRYIEEPGIRLGRWVVDYFANSRPIYPELEPAELRSHENCYDPGPYGQPALEAEKSS